jgi:5'-3' exonuclease
MNVISYEQVMNPWNFQIMGEDEVMTRFGVMPNQLVDLKALAGDKSVSLIR